MYDVHYFDCSGSSKLVASGVSHDAAATLARAEARLRDAGRMFLAGSEPPSHGSVVVIVDAVAQAA